MKVKEARELLEGYSGEELYRNGCKLFREEVDNLITLRSHGKKPSRGVIESSISQTKEWFVKVAEGLPWDNTETVRNIIQWETSDIWIKYKTLDPVIDDYGKKARLEILRGSPLPLFTALTKEALDAISGMMIGQLKAEATLHLKREEFAKGLGKRVCPYSEKERFCKYQLTYSMVGRIPTNIEALVFICTVDKCIKEE